MSTKPKKEVMLDVLWEEVKKRWVDLKFDQSLLQPVEYWANERKIHPLDHLLTVAHRAIVRGETL